MGFSEKLRQKRIDAGIKQVDLAKKVGVSLRTLQNYESGMRRPSNMIWFFRVANRIESVYVYVNFQIHLDIRSNLRYTDL